MNYKTIKKKYLILIIIMLLSIILGSIYVLILKDIPKTILVEEIKEFFISINSTNISYISNLISSLLSNIIYVLIIWLLGISIIGVPLIIFLFITKSFLFGFAITSIISVYGFKGLLGAFLYIFPHHIINISICLLLTYYSISFSKKLFKYLFLKQDINLKESINHYLNKLSFSLILIIISSFLETFLNPFLLLLFQKVI